MDNSTTGRAETQHASFKSKIHTVYTMTKAFQLINDKLNQQFVELRDKIGYEKSQLIRNA